MYAKLISCFLIAGFLTFFTIANAQVSVDEFLEQVEQKHPALQAERQYREARKLEHRTGLLPGGPSAEFNYLFGNPAPIGDQKEFGVSQQVDFPSVYVFEKRRADLLLNHADWQYRSVRQEKLLEAKELALKMIWLQQRKVLLSQWLQQAERLNNSIQTQLATGEANAIEAHKAKLNRLKVSEELQSVRADMENARQQMMNMVDGDTVVLADSTFPARSALPPLDTLVQSYRQQSPRLAMANSQVKAGEQAIKAEKARALPKLEGGYRYESIGNQTLQGPHIGISVPLWGHKNKVQHKKAQKTYFDLRAQQLQRSLEQQLKGLYKKYETKQQALQEYETIYRDNEPAELLQTALDSGEMSVLDYIRERVALFEAKQRYIRLQYELQVMYGKLMKYQL